MKQFLFSLVLAGGLMSVVLIPSGASADGGMMVMAKSNSEIVANPVQLPTAQQITNLKALVSLYSKVQALTLGIPEVLAEDEGRLNVIVSGTMRFACEGKGGQTGEWCVRHVGELGESYIDLERIDGFPYDERFAFDLTLLRTAADSSGYEYRLLSINNLEYQR